MFIRQIFRLIIVSRNLNEGLIGLFRFTCRQSKVLISQKLYKIEA